MSYSGSRGRGSTQNLPPKMAHKGGNPKPTPSTQQLYLFGNNANQSLYASQQQVQPIYQQEPKYQQYNSKTKSRVSIQPQYQQSVNPSNQKRPIIQQGPQKTVVKEEPKDSRNLFGNSLNNQKPPLAFNIVSRGNIPGLVFQQILVNS